MADISRTYCADIHEHVVTVDGREVATAHCANVTIDMWSVKQNGKLVGLAPSEAIATATLDRIATELRKAGN